MDTGSIILTSFLSTIPVYLFFATGFYLRHKQVIQADHDAPIMRIAMDVAYPCLVFHSIMKYMVLSGNETLSSVSFSLQAIGAGALELLLGIASAWLVAKMLSMRIGTGLRTFTLTAGVQNYAFFVIPIIQMLFTASNDPTLGVLFVHNVGCELVVWSIGVIIIAGGPGNLNMGVFFRGPLLAVIVGLALAPLLPPYRNRSSQEKGGINSSSAIRFPDQTAWPAGRAPSSGRNGRNQSGTSRDNRCHPSEPFHTSCRPRQN